MKRLVVLDAQGKYSGIVLPAELHAANLDGAGLEGFLHHRDAYLLPGMSVKEALALFERAEADALVVLENAASRKVIGVLSEQYALRRYSEELERRRKELAGV
ncbi:CBS domain-containing protein [Acidocella sp. MX-AZ03]|uniref:CBS domain-containing protein n=1 Tax=Acidocella sp. MX-AZ03 TaxID=2697363 RepID=UPI0022DD9661|nr:CBS domain-containing protein [Acidocella sp. MX-AZ03]WBO59292.1 CBS domain-containing protein [Acidocella sp. MX-AZ03]